jgi:chromosome partition protein MukB
VSRARIAALALVNWKGVFYERYLLDRHVTALEGANGAGKTTVMIAAYVVLLPDMSKLRFTNLGESGAVGGDRGIWGRLGEAGRPSYAVLDLELEGERVLAGVRLVRTTEPTVEPTAFLVTGLAADVRLSDVLLVRRLDGDHVPQLDELTAAVERAGGAVEVFRTIKDYFAALFDRGITPMRLGSDEERSKLNEMLRTSMTGGISRALTSELRGFLLKEETGLSDTLSRMRANLEACRRTRAEVSESRQLEREITAIYEAGAEMFAAAVHAARLAASEAQHRVTAAQPAVEAAVQAQRERLAEIVALEGRERELEARRGAARADLARATAERDRRVAVDGVTFRLAELDRELEVLAAAAAAARASQALATAERAATKQGRGAAREAYDRASLGLAHLQQGLDELVRRAHSHRQLERRLAEARTLLARPALIAETAAAALAELDAERARCEAERAGLDRELRDLEARRDEYARACAALVAIDPAADGLAVEARHGHARALLVRLTEREAVLGKAHELERDQLDAERLAARQRAARTLAGELGLAVTGGATAAATVARELDYIEGVVRDAEDTARDPADVRPQLEAQRARLAAIDDRLAGWHHATLAAQRLAAFAAAPATRGEVIALRDRVIEEHHALAARRTELEAARERTRLRAIALERSGTAQDPELARLRDELGGELLAERFEDLDVEAAGWVEARLGPLADALIVDDPASAARVLAGAARAAPTVWLVAAGSALDVRPGPDAAEAAPSEPRGGAQLALDPRGGTSAGSSPSGPHGASSPPGGMPAAPSLPDAHGASRASGTADAPIAPERQLVAGALAVRAAAATARAAAAAARGEGPGDDVICREPFGLRVTRRAEQPSLGRRARERQVAELHAQVARDGDALDELTARAALLTGWRRDADQLAAHVEAWLAGDPTRDRAGLESEIATLEMAAQARHERIRGAHAKASEARRRRDGLRRLLGDAALVDGPDHAARASELAITRAELAATRAELERIAPDRAVLAELVEILRRPPLDDARRSAQLDRAAGLAGALDRLFLARGALEDVVAHRHAAAWGDAEQALAAQSGLAPALEHQHAAARAQAEAAEQAEAASDAAWEAATTAAQAAEAHKAAAVAHRDRAAGELVALGGPSTAAADDHEQLVAAAIAYVNGIEADLRALTTAAALAAERRDQAAKAADDARARLTAETREAGPAASAWAELRERAETGGLLSPALASPQHAGRTSIQLTADAWSKREVLLDRVARARGGTELADAVRALPLDGPSYLRAWQLTREWLRHRVPVQVVEVDEPLLALERLRSHLDVLEGRLARQENDLRGASEDVARGIDIQLRRAGGQVRRLNLQLDGISFGSVRGIRVELRRIERMEQILRALRLGEAQELLFLSSIPIEEALDEIFRRYGGGRAGGERLLDYREYLELAVQIRRQTASDWESASPTRLSTGEAIGVGAAVMMVVLTEWERDANLLRARRTSGSLRFLFLDEANRLSRDNLGVLFDLCRTLDLQLLIAAPEVARAEGNTTYRLVRHVTDDGREEVLVSGRRAATPVTTDEATNEATADPAADPPAADPVVADSPVADPVVVVEAGR